MTAIPELWSSNREVLQRLGAPRCVILWLLFLCFSLALGYPTLNRYDPRDLGPDQQVYYRMTTGDKAPESIVFNTRVLVPWVARPFYEFARGRFGSWNPVWFGMLVSNSLFCATFCFLLLIMGYRVLGNLPLALLGCALVLLNYAAPDLWLSGFVDTSEACALMAVALLLFSDTWWPLPLVGIIGGLSKQSFLPFAVMFAAAWWLASERSKRKPIQLIWVGALAVTASITMMLVNRAITGVTMAPWTMASTWWDYGTVVENLKGGLFDRRFWYPFVWLVPLGIWRLKRFPRPWVMATAANALLAIAILAYSGIGNGTARPMFAIVAPLLSMSTAALIADERPWTLGSRSQNQNG